MRAALVALVLLAPAWPAAAAAGEPADFGDPLSVSGTWQAAETGWALLVLDGVGSSGEVHYATPPGTVTSHDWLYVAGPGGAANWPTASSQQGWGPLNGTLAFPEGRAGMLYVEAAGLRVRVVAAETSGWSNPPGQCVRERFPIDDQTAMRIGPEVPCNGDPSVVLATPVPSGSPAVQVELVATHLTRLDWHEADSACTGTACPDGARTKNLGAGGAETMEVQRFNALAAPAGTLEGRLTASLVMTGARQVDLAASGRVRLPDARGAAGIFQQEPGGRAVQASGNLTFADLAPVAGTPGRLSATIQGQPGTVRLDEGPLLQPGLAAALYAAGIAALLGLLVKFVVLPLFTRLQPEVALRHPRRVELARYIADHPGATLGELVARTGIPSGTARHHLEVLERAGHVVEHRHRNTRRFFENHGRHERTWADLVHLRVPELNRLHAWIGLHPDADQSAVLAVAGAWAWTRSTTQNRLAALVQAGLVEARRDGRKRLYRARPASGPRVE